MVRWPLLLGFIVSVLGNLDDTTSQHHFSTPSSEGRLPLHESYTLKWPVRKVAIIGAGPGSVPSDILLHSPANRGNNHIASGLISYREFVKAGFDVHIFERDTVPGGNWHYTDDVPDTAPVPNADSSVGDFVPSLPPNGVKLPYEEHYEGREAKELLRSHRGPKPMPCFRILRL
jgi:hypothetical protein